MSGTSPSPVRPHPLAGPVAHPLDDVARSSLAGAHAHLGRWRGRVARYHPEVARFVGHPAVLEPRDWADLAHLAGPGELVALRGRHRPPPGWHRVDELEVTQLDGSALRGEPCPSAVVLGPVDVPAMLDLVARTRPGPFGPRTIEMGTYLGIVEGNELIAMAGERLHPAGWTEISAVCTAAGHRGRGLAGRLVRAVGAGIRDRGERPFLHTRSTNAAALRLYRQLGFVVRKHTVALALRTPDRP